MLNRRYLLRFQFCLRVSLTVALLTVVATPSFSYLVRARQSAPELTVVAGEDAFELNWTAMAGTDCNALWAWTNPEGWQQIGGVNLTGTLYTHADAIAGTTYYHAIRSVNADRMDRTGDPEAVRLRLCTSGSSHTGAGNQARLQKD